MSQSDSTTEGDAANAERSASIHAALDGLARAAGRSNCESPDSVWDGAADRVTGDGVAEGVVGGVAEGMGHRATVGWRDADGGRDAEVLSSARLVVVPGMAQDEEAFAGWRGCFPRMEVVKRITPHGDESLRSYAERYADRLDTARPFVLVGASMGGMIVLEMARLVRPRAVVVVGGCASLRQMRTRAWLLTAMGAAMPAGWLTPTPGRVGLALGRLDRLNAEQRAVIVRMVRRQPPKLTRWGLRAILGWRGVPLEEVESPVHFIHGARDAVFAPLKSQVPKIIPGAGHFLSITHPRVTARAIAERLPATPPA